MGDVPESNQPQGNLSTTPSGSRSSNPPQNTLGPQDHPDTPNDQHGYPLSHPPQTQSPFHAQLQQQFYPQYQSRQNVQPPAHANISYSQPSARDSPFNMATLGNALPDPNFAQGYGQQSPQRFSTRSSTSPGTYQVPQQGPQYLGQSAMNQAVNPGYQYSPQYQGTFTHPQQLSSQVQQPGMGPQYFPGQNFMIPPLQQAQQFYYPSGQYASQNQAYPTSPMRSYPSQFGGRNAMQEGGSVGRQINSEHLSAVGGDNSGFQGRADSVSSSVGGPSIPRGPPRKPKQSGHALWVGNLPPGANVIDLKEHFSREATDEILSVFLISKSNCAFVNYRTEESCSAAMSRFHDSRFQGVRLVCRLRRSSVNAVPGVPTGPSALTGSQTHGAKEGPKESDIIQPEAETSAETKDNIDPKSQATDRYFIVKSLTVEDLELSVRNGIWATQSHNEEALNEAYENSESVHLIFSANKSGEYFGYARMVSSINNDPAAAIEFAPKPTATEDPDLPKAIPTPATDSAPKGRIIDDSARGTIFWEAEVEESEVDAENPASDNSDQEGDGNPSKAWGKPFKIEWQSTNRLPFYRTRGLRNPWNSNREVKIARDGTELETSIGRRLVQMFHREPSPSALPMSNVQMQMPSGMGGYPQMRY